MRLLVGLAQPLDRHMRVDLGRREALMAEDLLYGAQVGAPFQHVRGRGVAPAMWPWSNKFSKS